MRGMMLFQDGSTHEWLLGQANIDLIVTLDDATSEITSMFFVAQEGTISTLQGIKETIESKGLFSSFYTDRGSHYFNTPQAGGKVDRENLTQVGRALKQLGIQHIASYSPQGRGRMERVFGTLQGRLPHDLRLAGIEDISDANEWLKNTYMAQHNTRFAVKPAEETSAYVPYIGDLEQILCLQEERVVGQDNCVRYNNKTLQIPKDIHRHHYVKATVLVREYLDKSLSIFHGPRPLAKYNRFGGLIPRDEEAIITKAA
jgi:transposase InsO family protein